MTCALIVGVALVAFAAWGPYAWALLRVKDARRNWSTALGTIVESKLEGFRSARGWRQWRPLVRYRYRVGDRWYRGERYRVTGDPLSAPRGPVQEIVDAHPPGEPVTVYYDPAAPARSALLLEQAPWSWEWAVWWTGWAPVIACAWFLGPDAGAGQSPRATSGAQAGSRSGIAVGRPWTHDPPLARVGPDRASRMGHPDTARPMP